ncbi:MAG: hypothetical protein JWO95_1125 [Verrucomicrobiales bacterium]|nr:hypothetical protein [Verrucomicrobiales bacterium]
MRPFALFCLILAAGCAQRSLHISDIHNPWLIKQFPDNRRFVSDGRTCFGTELNGHVPGVPHRGFLRSNRIINPVTPQKSVVWEVATNTEVIDGAGIRLGTVAVEHHDNRTFPGAKFNYGMSKTINGRLYLYCFATDIVPDAAVVTQMDRTQFTRGVIGTSAWLCADDVTAKQTLLERFGVGRGKLPSLPLQKISYRITGGDPNAYRTPYGELAIVKQADGPVPSHYLRRPPGTINVLYSVPGFGLGGQGLDSFLISDNLTFRPAVGVREFIQPTYYPLRHPQAKQVGPKTMTFIYGAVEAPHCEPVFGWVAKEALAEVP